MNAPITETASFVAGPPATVTVSPTQINEGQTANYTISIPQAMSKPVAIHFKISGTANQVPSDDYTLNSGSPVTIPVGQTSVAVTLNAPADAGGLQGS